MKKQKQKKQQQRKKAIKIDGHEVFWPGIGWGGYSGWGGWGGYAVPYAGIGAGIGVTPFGPVAGVGVGVGFGGYYGGWL